MLRLAEIRDLAFRFVPLAAADRRLYTACCRSWWPAHEIGHFLVATRAECHQELFGLDATIYPHSSCAKAYAKEMIAFRYVIAKEIAATTISQKLLRRAGHKALADEEIQYTDESTLDYAFERWCKRAVHKMLQANNVARLPTTISGLKDLLTRKASAAGTTFYTSRRAVERAPWTP